MERFLELLDGFASIFIGRWRQLWPDWQSTRSVTQNTRPSRKREKLRGNRVTPLERYQFHTPFHTYTDGKQWVVQCNSSYVWHRANAFVGMFISSIWLFVFYDLSMILALIPIAPTLYYIYLSRTGGEDTWVVFDRTTGNVCFWKRDADHSLTVPFEKVNCYWIEVFRRGVSHSLYFMPTENLPNERHRWWQVMFGTATTYEQAQYFWRVLTDFMDKSKPIPSVPGLSHQLYFVEKHGYTIEDLTEGEKEITFEDFEEAEEEFNRITSELDEKFGKMLEPECFDVDAIIEFYNKAPFYAQRDLSLTAVTRLEMYMDGLKSKTPYMCPLYPKFKELFTIEEYESRVKKLAEYFFEIHIEYRKTLGMEVS